MNPSHGMHSLHGVHWMLVGMAIILGTTDVSVYYKHLIAWALIGGGFLVMLAIWYDERKSKNDE